MKKGHIITERYRVLDEIGKGGQGTVYLVEDRVDQNTKRAIKVYERDLLPSDKTWRRIQDEVDALQRIDSERVVTIIDTNISADTRDLDEPPYIVMELAKFQNLRKHNYFMKDIELSLRLFRLICEGVKDIHSAKILHRDLKPSNILIVEDERDLKVGDFGICYIGLEEDEKRATNVREKVGPLFFAAPEQTSLPPTFSERSDIYSLGRLLYFMITGEYEHSPSDDYTPVSIHLGLTKSHPVDELIQGMMSFDPRQRPKSVADVIVKIHKLLDEGQEELAPFRLTKIQKRILKYIRSNDPPRASFGEILQYISDFYQIETKSSLISPPWISGGVRWEKLADQVENSLEQLEEAGILKFQKGDYILVEKS